MAGTRITLTLEGLSSDEEHVQLSALIEQLQKVKTALNNAERLVTRKNQVNIIYKIVRVSHNSPLELELEAEIKPPKTKKKARRDYSADVVKRFRTDLYSIGKNKVVPPDVDTPALEAYLDMSINVGEKLKEFNVSAEGESVNIDYAFKKTLNDILGVDEISWGTVTGTLEALNFHSRNIFVIYPPVGAQRIQCDFGNDVDIKEKVLDAVKDKRYVRVGGELHYKPNLDFAYRIKVFELDVLPTSKDLPSYRDLKGIAPDLTGEQTTKQFLEGTEDAW